MNLQWLQESEMYLRQFWNCPNKNKEQLEFVLINHVL